MADRDMDAKPYTADEQRVVDWLRSRTPDVGAGDDPIGFLLASYELVIGERNELRSGEPPRKLHYRTMFGTHMEEACERVNKRPLVIPYIIGMQRLDRDVTVVFSVPASEEWFERELAMIDHRPPRF